MRCRTEKKASLSPSGGVYPVRRQEKYFSFEDKKRYVKILAACDEKILLAERIFQRLYAAAERLYGGTADALIAYCRKEKGAPLIRLTVF